MNKYKQVNTDIGDTPMPLIISNNKKYYPIAYLYKKILYKNKPIIKDLKSNGYTDIVKFKIDFNKVGGGSIQNTSCISEDELINILKNIYIGKLDEEKIEQINLLLEYLKQPLINNNPRFIDEYEYENEDYIEYEKDCITEVLHNHTNLGWQKCIKCNKYYPYHKNFFIHDNRKKELDTRCRNCIGYEYKIIHNDNYLNNIYNLYGEDVYIAYKNHDVVGIYNNYIINNLHKFPDTISNKNDYLTIIKYLYNSKRINKDELTLTYLINSHKLLKINSHLKADEVYEYLFEDDPNRYPWRYPKYRLHKLDMNMGKVIYENYIEENNIVIEDIYNFNYGDILIKSRLRQFEGNLLQFVMNYHDNKYPAYKFKIRSKTYWNNKDNRTQALRYLIEEDMQLELEKIPLYLTITSIRSVGTSTMYSVLKNYYSNLYEWVNEVYPDAFDPKDFDINYMRNEFDSQDEYTIHDILKENFDNVVYNPSQTEYTIKLLEKIPDWFVITENGCIIVEYFGLWNKERGMYNTRTRDYINRSKDKIERYKTLRGYRFLYLYPEDMENNCEGIYKKIEKVKNNKELIRVG